MTVVDTPSAQRSLGVARHALVRGDVVRVEARASLLNFLPALARFGPLEDSVVG